MRKKIILLAAALMMFMGVVSASSINGDYKGNPIVKVASGTNFLQVDGVPAMILDGSTMVPISILRQLGATVEWYSDDYVVDVKMPQSKVEPTNVTESSKLISQELTKIGAKYFRIMYDGMGSFAEIDYDITGNDLGVLSNIALVILKTDANELWVNNYMNGVMVEFLKISRKDIEAFKNGDLTLLEFSDRWNYSTPKSQPNTSKPISKPPVASKSIPVLYSNDGKVYLGKLTTNDLDSDSIFNSLGTYGSDLASKSIWNDLGIYGSSLSSKSAFNDLASEPPIILLDGKIIGHLTTNSFKNNAVSPIGLKEWLKSNGY